MITLIIIITFTWTVQRSVYEMCLLHAASLIWDRSTRCCSDSSRRLAVCVAVFLHTQANKVSDHSELKSEAIKSCHTLGVRSRKDSSGDFVHLYSVRCRGSFYAWMSISVCNRKSFLIWVLSLGHLSFTRVLHYVSDRSLPLSIPHTHTVHGLIRWKWWLTSFIRSSLLSHALKLAVS